MLVFGFSVFSPSKELVIMKLCPFGSEEERSIISAGTLSSLRTLIMSPGLRLSHWISESHVLVV